MHQEKLKSHKVKNPKYRRRKTLVHQFDLGMKNSSFLKRKDCFKAYCVRFLKNEKFHFIFICYKFLNS